MTMDVTASLYEVRTNASVLNDTVNVTAVPPHKDFYENAQFITGLICYPIMCLFGMLGNIFILIVFAHKSMQTSTNVFLSALAVSDFIKLVNDSLYFLTILLLKVDEPSGNKCFGYLYPYAHFVFNFSVCVSSWLTISVAIERYILVCHPARSKTWTSIYRAKMISVVCFVVMTSVAVPSAFRYRTVEVIQEHNGVNITKLDVELTELWQNERFVVAYNWVQSLLRSMIPLVILVITSTAIINALRKTRANKKMASRNKITIMLIIVIIFFLVCIIPDAVMSGFFNLGYAESNNYLVKGVREITDMLLGVNAAINYTLYMIFNKLFRDQFIALFCGRCATGSKAAHEEYRPLKDKYTSNTSNGMTTVNKSSEL